MTTKIPKWIDEILKGLENEVINARPYSLTFAPTGNLDAEQKQVLEAYLKEHFELWFDTWVAAKSRHIRAGDKYYPR